MKILFFGDSITDALRDKNPTPYNTKFGTGFVMQIVGRLFERDPVGYDIINTGISGHRVVDLYARIKKDAWNYEPDVINILIGVNDVWHEINYQNGVELDRFEKVYRMLIEDTKKALPNTKIIINEPFVLKGSATEENFDEFLEVYKYAEVASRLAKEYDLYFLPLQKAFDEAAEKYGADTFLRDGVHPTVQGSVLIATEWMKLFDKIQSEA